MNNFEILYTDTKLVKLTITPNRVTLKFPKNSTEDFVKRYIKYTNDIVPKFKPEYSYRGTFREDDLTVRIELTKRSVIEASDIVNFSFSKTTL